MLYALGISFSSSYGAFRKLPGSSCSPFSCCICSTGLLEINFCPVLSLQPCTGNWAIGGNQKLVFCTKEDRSLGTWILHVLQQDAEKQQKRWENCQVTQRPWCVWVEWSWESRVSNHPTNQDIFITADRAAPLIHKGTEITCHRMKKILTRKTWKKKYMNEIKK